MKPAISPGLPRMIRSASSISPRPIRISPFLFRIQKKAYPFMKSWIRALRSPATSALIIVRSDSIRETGLNGRIGS